MADTDFTTAGLSSLFASHLLLAEVNTTAIDIKRTGKFGVKDFSPLPFNKKSQPCLVQVHGIRRLLHMT